MKFPNVAALAAVLTLAFAAPAAMAGKDKDDDDKGHHCGRHKPCAVPTTGTLPLVALAAFIAVGIPVLNRRRGTKAISKI